MKSLCKKIQNHGRQITLFGDVVIEYHVTYGLMEIYEIGGGNYSYYNKQ